jgi:hypothetical protein
VVSRGSKRDYLRRHNIDQVRRHRCFKVMLVLTDSRPDGHVDLGVFDGLEDLGRGVAVGRIEAEPCGELRQQLRW